jgi:hypothetical protein
VPVAIAALLLLSDERLKIKVRRVDTSASGLPIYRYAYWWAPDEEWLGVLAQDVLRIQQLQLHGPAPADTAAAFPSLSVPLSPPPSPSPSLSPSLAGWTAAVEAGGQESVGVAVGDAPGLQGSVVIGWEAGGARFGGAAVSLLETVLCEVQELSEMQELARAPESSLYRGHVGGGQGSSSSSNSSSSNSSSSNSAGGRGDGSSGQMETEALGIQAAQAEAIGRCRGSSERGCHQLLLDQ